MQTLKNATIATLRTVPPYALFLAGFGAVVAFGLVRLHGLLQAAIG